MDCSTRVFQVCKLYKSVLIDTANFFQVDFQNFAIFEEGPTKIFISSDLFQVANEKGARGEKRELTENTILKMLVKMRTYILQRTPWINRFISGIQIAEGNLELDTISETSYLWLFLFDKKLDESLVVPNSRTRAQSD